MKVNVVSSAYVSSYGANGNQLSNFRNDASFGAKTIKFKPNKPPKESKNAPKNPPVIKMEKKFNPDDYLAENLPNDTNPSQIGILKLLLRIFGK